MRVRKSAEERKSEIVETTLRLADKDGPDRLSTETIARTIHLTQAAIFRHFPTKQTLWEAVAARIGEKFQQRWQSIDNPNVPEPEKLQALITSQLKLIQSTPAILIIGLAQGLVLRWSLSGRTIDLVGEGSRLLSILLGSFSASLQQLGSADMQAAAPAPKKSHK